MVGALRGTPAGKSKRAARMRDQGKRLPLMLPRDPKYLEKRFQFLHVDDMARLLTFLLYRPDSDPLMTIMNVAGRGARHAYGCPAMPRTGRLGGSRASHE